MIGAGSTGRSDALRVVQVGAGAMGGAWLSMVAESTDVELVGLVDLAPTFCTIAGLDAEPWMEGRSLPVDDADADARGHERALTTWDSELLGVAVHLRTITRDGLVCTTYEAGTVHDGTEGELYDLADDPLQRVNRWDDPAMASVRDDLVADLAQHGFRLWEEDGQLLFRAAQGALTEQRRALLRTHKDAVLDLLRAQRALTPDPGARHEPFPLTDIQGAYLVGRGTAYPYGGVACHTYVELAFPPDTDPQRLIAAWHAVVRRHDMLRAIVHPDGYQQVLADPPAPDVPVTHGDAGRIRAELSARVPDTDRWPLHDVRVSVAEDAVLLHLSVDLLVVDYASLQMVLAEVEDVYHGRELPPLELTFRDYVLAYTNASMLVSEDFQDVDDLDGVFAGYDEESATYDPSSWAYAGHEDGAGSGGVSTVSASPARSVADRKVPASRCV